MSNIRIIARLDIKGPNLIKGVHLEGLRVIGNPNEYAVKYYEQGIDELIYMDVVASLYGRNSLKDIIQETVKDVFVPLTVGGGIRSVADAQEILRSGADKIAINTAAVSNPSLIKEIAESLGSQCMVLSVEGKKNAAGFWEVFTDNGREPSGRNVLEWVEEGVALGAGEILLTSIDKEGTRQGFDVELAREVSDLVSVPVIASGGLGKCEDMIEVVEAGKVDAVAVADAFHYNRISIQELRDHAHESRLHVRRV